MTSDGYVKGVGDNAVGMIWALQYQSLLWHRSIRLGYNVLLMDSDMIIMDDPYKYFKHPPFKDITVLNQAESPVGPNSGMVYVQNAAPDGPAAFMFAGITANSFSLPPSLSAALSLARLPSPPRSLMPSYLQVASAFAITLCDVLCCVPS